MNKREYKLTTCNGTVKTFNTIHELKEVLDTDKITMLEDNDTCFLSSGMDISKNDKYGKFLYKVEVNGTK